MAADDQWLDCARETFELFLAASRLGIHRIVVLSSMEVLANYPTDIPHLMPAWQPRPSCDPASLGAHLAEFVARQFAFRSGAAGGAGDGRGRQ